MKEAAGAGEPMEVDAHAEVGVRNSQPEGIGRVANLDDLVAWNNLGRNIVFADGGVDRSPSSAPPPSHTTTSSPSTTSTCTPS